MAIINVTPDSFSDGGRFYEPDKALTQARKLIEEGADILDIGAETTRPGSLPTPADEEWRRLEPVLSGLAKMENCPPISIDTNKAEVAKKAIKAGASIINDIYAGRKENAILDVAAETGVPLILMHMQGEPRTMQVEPFYTDVVSEVHGFLLEQAKIAEARGVSRSRIILDPGIGFGKNKAHNLSLIKRFDEVIPPGYHSLIALSRKAFLGHILGGVEPDKRDLASAVASSLAVLKGAEIVRVHNVALARVVLKVVSEVLSAA
jgi:dihydropteroate synthase